MRDWLGALDTASRALGKGDLDEAELTLQPAGILAPGDRPEGLQRGGEQFLRRQLAQPAPLQTFSGDGSKLQSLAVSRDGSLAAAGDERGNVRIWNLETNELEKTLKDREGELRGLAFSPTRNELAVTERSVDRCVVSLRAKIEEKPERPKLLVTVQKVGYRFELEDGQ